MSAGSLTDTVNANGNLTNRGSDTFAYDQANRLTSATVSGVTSTDTYDGDGKRVSQTTGTTTTNYVYDINDSLPNVLT
ncbi:MAG: RHS repeat-associated core domain-containing protein, partial [Candidatus Dormibacteraceae bacterium]